jgi:hypothetical protein
MRIAPSILAGALWCPILLAQAPTPGPIRPDPLTLRGFSLTVPYRAFTKRARAVTASDSAPLLCNTSRRTAQLMECGVQMRDPTDGVGYYVAAYVLEGRVAFLSFGDSGTVTLVTRAQREMETRFGRPRASRAGMWEWRSGREVARLTWRGRGDARWIYISMWDEPLMDRIARYVPRRSH